MGIKDFFEAVASVIGWALLILAFGMYLTFRDYLESIPTIVVIIGIVIVMSLGVLLILLRNGSRTRQAKEAGGSTGSMEKIVHITPLDELKHDVLGLVTFGLVVIWVLFTGNGIDGNDFAQAGIAYLGVMLVRKIYKERFY